MTNYSENIFLEDEDNQLSEFTHSYKKGKSFHDYEQELSLLTAWAKDLYSELEEKRNKLHPPLPDIDYVGGKLEKNTKNMKMIEDISLSFFNRKLPEKSNMKVLEKNIDTQSDINMKSKFLSFKDTTTTRIIKAIFIAGLGSGAIATFLFNYKIGIIVGVISAILNIHGIYYRDKHHSKYYYDEV